MQITLHPYSVVMALMWGSIFMFFFDRCCRSNRFVIKHGISPLLILVFGVLFRIVLPIDFPFSIVLASSNVYANISEYFRSQIDITYTVSLSVIEILLLLWAVIFVVRFIIPLILHGKFVLCLKKESESERAQEYRESIQDSCIIKRNTILFIDAPPDSIPFTIGFFRPIIVMPNTDYSKEGLRHIILHEWCHYKQKDAWVKLLMYFVTCLFWWNPLVYLFKKDVEQVLEIRCDLTMTTNMTSEETINYLNTILSVIKKSHKPDRVSYAFATGLIDNVRKKKGVDIKQRFRLALENGRQPIVSRRKNILLTTTISILFYFLSYLFILQPSYYDASIPKGNTSVGSDNSYLIRDTGESKSYLLYVDNEFVARISNDDAKNLKEILPIKENVE